MVATKQQPEDAHAEIAEQSSERSSDTNAHFANGDKGKEPGCARNLEQEDVARLGVATHGFGPLVKELVASLSFAHLEDRQNRQEEQATDVVEQPFKSKERSEQERDQRAAAIDLFLQGADSLLGFGFEAAESLLARSVGRKDFGARGVVFNAWGVGSARSHDFCKCVGFLDSADVLVTESFQD